MAGKKRAKKAKEPLEFRNTQLSDALQTQDMAAVAFALRHGPTVVPLMRPGQRDNPLDVGEVWTYRDPNTGDVALLLFSDAAHKPATLPPGVALQSPGWLRAFLGAHEQEITTVFFDIAGPHPLQASPADLIAALDA
ncbi:dehydrogenase [Microbacterium hibisci]|uniref:dehydrogenase n=1 Tax=Microbacterium hibisci TaxID=2036000 RepID=UPI001943543C|nr:dehydrogenase [Microbacterium hibisci]